MSTFATQAEIEQHLAAFTSAWKDYSSSHNDIPYLGHLEATWRCNTLLDWFETHGLHLWTDIIWEPRFEAFILTEAIIHE